MERQSDPKITRRPLWPTLGTGWRAIHACTCLGGRHARVALVGCLLVVLGGCGGKKEAPVEEKSPKPATMKLTASGLARTVMVPPQKHMAPAMAAKSATPDRCLTVTNGCKSLAGPRRGLKAALAGYKALQRKAYGECICLSLRALNTGSLARRHYASAAYKLGPC